MGGLGNQMFQYAAGFALARRHGTELKLDLNFLSDRSKRLSLFTVRNYALDMFRITATPATGREIARFVLPRRINRYLYRVLQMVWPKRNCFDDVPPEYFAAIPADAYLTGYWHDKAYYAGCEEGLRREFTFARPLPPACAPVVEAMAASGNAVSLHVRRGDYVGHPTLDGVVGRDYYVRALGLLRSRLGDDMRVFVFSDDLDWCRRELVMEGVDMFFVDGSFTGGKDEYDLHLMTLCRHFIIANSSFSFWGAWLSAAEGKTVVAPARWKRGQDYDRKPIIPDDWITL